MNILEYLAGDLKDQFYYDEHGNIYIDYNAGYTELSKFMHYDYNGTYYLAKDEYEKCSEYSVIISAEKEDNRNVEGVRRPYYRMRGKPVTKEQAFEIIRRTDNFFGDEIEEIEQHEDFLGCINFDNWLIDKHHYPQGYGWVHTDGTIGSNAITQKYPTEEEFIIEWAEKLMAFPYLDFIIALTWWNEAPVIENNILSRDEFETNSYDKLFLDAIGLGIYVHDKKIELLSRKATIEKYKEYDSLYGHPREKFVSDYYERNNIIQVDLPYLKRCIEAYGLDAEKVLHRKNVWRY